MTNNNNIKNAILDWNDGAPQSVAFDDIYFSGDGAAETTHVFLNGNNLPERFTEAGQFTICELGFGTGLNFLVAWDAWRRANKQAHARLDFFSIEAFPLTPDDLRKALAAQPNLAPLAEQLIAQYPPVHPGVHRLQFADGVSLTLYFGDANEALRTCTIKADAWFLDGFAPAKNPEMWSPDLMQAVARQSTPGATFATFTVAGDVRRGLSAAGFTLEKRPGFGRKREMLAGKLTSPPEPPPSPTPWFETRPEAPLPVDATIAIIGAGIAGASVAYELSRAGYAPTVFDAAGPASGASGNPAGLIMPRLDADTTPIARFHIHAYLHTVRLLRELPSGGQQHIFNGCSAQRHFLTAEVKRRFKKLSSMALMPEDWISIGNDTLIYPQAGVVDPPALVAALLGNAPCRKKSVSRLTRNDGQWRLHFNDQTAEEFDTVIIANGRDALKFAQLRGLPLAGSAGQVDYFSDAHAPDHAHIYGPYIAPAPKGGVVIGATYQAINAEEAPQTSAAATQSNIDIIAKAAPQLVKGLSAEQSIPRASVRCVTPDQTPIAGPVPDWGYYSGAYDGLRQGLVNDYPTGQTQAGLYVLTGLGSRGLVTAPLAAAMIAAEITGAPVPVDRAITDALHPARFFIRSLKRG